MFQILALIAYYGSRIRACRKLNRKRETGGQCSTTVKSRDR